MIEYSVISLISYDIQNDAGCLLHSFDFSLAPRLNAEEGWTHLVKFKSKGSCSLSSCIRFRWRMRWHLLFVMITANWRPENLCTVTEHYSFPLGTSRPLLLGRQSSCLVQARDDVANGPDDALNPAEVVPHVGVHPGQSSAAPDAARHDPDNFVVARPRHVNGVRPPGVALEETKGFAEQPEEWGLYFLIMNLSGYYLAFAIITGTLNCKWFIRTNKKKIEQ